MSSCTRRIDEKRKGTALAVPVRVPRCVTRTGAHLRSRAARVTMTVARPQSSLFPALPPGGGSTALKEPCSSRAGGRTRVPAGAYKDASLASMGDSALPAKAGSDSATHRCCSLIKTVGFPRAAETFSSRRVHASLLHSARLETRTALRSTATSARPLEKRREAERTALAVLSAALAPRTRVPVLAAA